MKQIALLVSACLALTACAQLPAKEAAAPAMCPGRFIAPPVRVTYELPCQKDMYSKFSYMAESPKAHFRGGEVIKIAGYDFSRSKETGNKINTFSVYFGVDYLPDARNIRDLSLQERGRSILLFTLKGISANTLEKYVNKTTFGEFIDVKGRHWIINLYNSSQAISQQYFLEINDEYAFESGYVISDDSKKYSPGYEKEKIKVFEDFLGSLEFTVDSD